MEVEDLVGPGERGSVDVRVYPSSAAVAGATPTSSGRKWVSGRSIMSYRMVPSLKTKRSCSSPEDPFVDLFDRPFPRDEPLHPLHEADRRFSRRPSRSIATGYSCLHVDRERLRSRPAGSWQAGHSGRCCPACTAGRYRPGRYAPRRRTGFCRCRSPQAGQRRLPPRS